MLTLIVNPTAGSGTAAKYVEKLHAQMQASGRAYQLLLTEYPGHATELARTAAAQPDCEGVIAVGGDGTDYEVACGLMGSNVPLGIVPLGTGNDFIKTLGTPKEPDAALDFILTHQPRPVDVGLVNDRLFLNVGGTGFDVMVLEHTEYYKGRFKGLTPYMLGLLRSIALYKPTHLRIDADGRIFDQEVLICSIANGRVFGGGIPICPPAEPDDGYLDLILVKHVPRWKIPFYLPALMMGRITQKKVTTHLRCKEIRVSSDGMTLNSDGELSPAKDAYFRVAPGALRLFW